MKTKGVTIIELGVVIILIGLISVLLSPFVKKVRERARTIRCFNNLQKISIAIREYALENDEKLPQDLALLYAHGYIDEDSVFDCPFSSKVGSAGNPDYEYVVGYDFKSPENPEIVSDKKGNHRDGTIHVLYMNGEIVKKGVVAE